MQFNITIIQVTEAKDKKNARGGVFNAVDIVYKRDGKVEAKSFPDWANKEIYDTLKGLVKDGNYTVTTEKVGEYWKWLAVSPIGTADLVPESKSAVSAASSANGSGPKTATGKVLGSNYETREERQTRQKLIVAQSSVSNAVALVAANKGKATTEDVLVEAEKLYNFVFSIATKDISDIPSDIPE